MDRSSRGYILMNLAANKYVEERSSSNVILDEKTGSLVEIKECANPGNHSLDCTKMDNTENSILLAANEPIGCSPNFMLDEKTGWLVEIKECANPGNNSLDCTEMDSTENSIFLAANEPIGCSPNFILDEKTGSLVEIIDFGDDSKQNLCSSENASSGEEELHYNAPGMQVKHLDEKSGLRSSKRSLKRLSCPKEWTRNKVKRARQEGLPYLSKNRKKNMDGDVLVERKKRILGPSCNSRKCLKSKMLKCGEITGESRKVIFECFWKNLSWEQRNTYVCGLVDKMLTNQKTTGKSSSKRTFTFNYHLKINNQRIRVCKKMFLNTLALGEFTILSWVKKGNEHGLTTQKVSKNNKEVANRSKLANAKIFLEQLPKMPSHYCRSDTNKEYLDLSYKSIRDVYKQYRCFLSTQSETEFITYSCFLKKMHSMNIGLYSPKKDQCDTCYTFKSGNIGQEQYDEHILQKNRAREEKNRDKHLAIAGEINAYTVDVQAVQTIPHISAGAVYFKQKLNCHQFTIYNLKNSDAVCYVWHEGEGGMDANMFASCITHFLDNEDYNQDKKPVVFYSDGCCAQNRNVVLSNALYNYASQNAMTIFQKYLVKGHTQMECDTVHATIEKKKKNRELFVPADFVEVIKTARNNNPYKVHYVDHSFFKKYSDLSFYKSIRPGFKKGDLCVTDIRALKYANDGIQYKINFDSDWEDLPRRRRAFQSSPIIENLYDAPLAITKRKYNDLISLTNLIPKDYQFFYNNLKFE